MTAKAGTVVFDEDMPKWAAAVPRLATQPSGGSGR